MKSSSLRAGFEMGPGFDEAGPCWICGSSVQRYVHDAVFDLSIYREQDSELAAYTGQTVAMLRCDGCGFTQPARLPSMPRYFERMYDQRWSPEWVSAEFHSEAKTAIFAGILDELERRLPDERRTLLDIGAHVGKFVSMAHARGWRAQGVELNPTTAAYARGRTGLPIHERPLAQLAGLQSRFDAVTMTDVLEHIPRPLDALRSAAATLAPGGWIAIKVPCGPNQLWKERVRAALGRAARASVADNLVHVSHFTPKALREALARAGFSEIRLAVGVPERTGGTGAPVLLSNAARLGAYYAARLLGGTGSPIAFNLQACGQSRGGREEHGA